jgi:hypothetical protein
MEFSYCLHVQAAPLQVPLLARQMTFVDGRDLAVEQDRQTLGRTNRSTDIDRRTRLAVGRFGFAVLEEGVVARIGPEDLVALRVPAGLGLSDRAGTNDLPLPHGLVEARERRILGASEADSAVALSVGATAIARAGVGRAASLRRSDRLRQTIGADHVFVVGACGVDRADVLVDELRNQLVRQELFLPHSSRIHWPYQFRLGSGPGRSDRSNQR